MLARAMAGKDVVKSIKFRRPLSQNNWSIKMTGSDGTQLLRDAFASWIKESTAGFNVAATLTYTPSYAPTSLRELERNASRFCDRFNRDLGYGCNHRRSAKYDKRASAPMVIINDGDGQHIHFHHHLALVQPFNMSESDFIEVVSSCWQKCIRGGAARTEVERIESDGWHYYLASKLKIGNQEQFDTKNSNIY
jgi:hypothetical protein